MSAALVRAQVVDVEVVVPDVTDLEAERAVLAAVLLNESRAIPRLSALLAASDFYDPKHATIWEAFLAIHARGVEVDVLTTAAELATRNRLNACGGTEYLGELTDSMPTIAHCEAHAALVVEASRRRRIGAIGERMVLASRDGSRDPEKLRDAAVEALRAMRFGRGASASSSLDLVAALMTSIEDGLAGRGTRALRFGVSTLDRMSGGGMKRGGAYFLAARPGIGKTALACQVAGSVAADGECVLYVALEPSRADVMQSTIANRASVDLVKLTRSPHLLTQGDLDAVANVGNTVSTWPLYVVDASERETPDTVARIETVMRSLPTMPSLVIVDHLLKLHPTRRHDRQHEGTAEVVGALVSLGKRTGATILTLCHIGRGVRTSSGLYRRPSAEDIAGGDAMNRDADGIIVLHREDKYPTAKENVDNRLVAGLVDLLAPKLRGVEDNTFGRMRFRGEVQRFEPIDAEPGDHIEPQTSRIGWRDPNEDLDDNTVPWRTGTDYAE